MDLIAVSIKLKD